MGIDLCGLVRRDHDDLDCALGAMVDPATSADELVTLLDVFRLALAVHSATETRILENLLKRVQGPRMIGLIVTQSRIEHIAQRAASDVLSMTPPATAAWYERALELRVLVIDHAGRAEQSRWMLEDHVPNDVRRALTSEYAIERMRMLANTSPILEAQRRL